MSEEVAVVDSELVPGENEFLPRRVRVTYKCDKCAHVWTRTFAAMPKKDPPCPNRECVAVERTALLAQQVANLTRMLEEQRAPAHIGQKLVVKAIDETAKIVMEDQKMTDLRDGIRAGETMAPKLPVPMQKAADSFFGGGGKVDPVGGGAKVTMAQKRMEALGRRAIAGAFRNASVAPNQVLPTVRPPSITQVNPSYVRKDGR